MEEMFNKILAKLEGLEKGQQRLEAEQKGLAAGQQRLEAEQKGLAAEQKSLVVGQKQLFEIVERIEETQQRDVVAIMKVISDKFDLMATKEETRFLASKIMELELEVHKIKQKIG
jgi:hypothetical protein